MAGLQNITTGDALPEAYLDEVAKQAIPQYASAAARDADAVLSAALREGLTVYLLDTNCRSVYTGSGWSTEGPLHGALLAWTPVVVQGATPTLTNQRSVYQRIGRVIHAWFYVSVASGAGTAFTAVTVSLPVVSGSSAGTVGSYHFRQNATGKNSMGVLKLASTTTVSLLNAAATIDAESYLGQAGTEMDDAVVVSDFLMGHVTYDAAADA